MLIEQQCLGLYQQIFTLIPSALHKERRIFFRDGLLIGRITNDIFNEIGGTVPNF